MRSPTLADVFEISREALELSLHVALPARVERYDASKQLVDAKPLIRRRVQDEFGNVVIENRKVISNIPVAFPGAGGFALTFPVAVGDTVLLVFADLSLDAWLSKGGEADPVGESRHGLTDAIAIPGLRSFAEAMPDAHPDHATLGQRGGPQAHFSPTEIQLNAPATEAAVKGTTYRANEAAANTATQAALAAVQAALTALALAVPNVGALGTFGPAAALACGAASASAGSAAAAIGTLEGASATYLSTVVKVG